MLRAEIHGPRIRVHEQGDRSLDGMFRLIELADREQPLHEVLTAMCAEVATIARADVASIYVRETDADGPAYVMRGNVGFPDGAVGVVRLRAGEGITGFAAERLRPVSLADAERDQHFKYIPGLGEERFPALLAVPVLRDGGAAGVLVLQRRQARAFTAEEVVLATALVPVINHALERVAERERSRSRRRERGVARLRGVHVSGGTAMGRAVVLPTLAALAGVEAPAGGSAGAVPPEEVLDRLAADLRKATAAARGSLSPLSPAGCTRGRTTHPATPRAFGATAAAAEREMVHLSFVLEDRRLRNRLVLACAAPAPLKALSELARDYARVPFRAASGDPATAELMAERAAEIEDLCVIVHAAMNGRPLVRAGAVVVAERLRGFPALYALARGATAFVVDGDVPGEAVGASLARAAGVPVLASVAGVFSWVQPDDLLVVDADAAQVSVNPTATAVARLRRSRA
jgi:phosphotransferase system enzyme I (PtsP)